MSTVKDPMISARMPDALIQQIRIVVTENKNARRGPISQQEILVEAVRDWLIKHEGRGAAG